MAKYAVNRCAEDGYRVSRRRTGIEEMTTYFRCNLVVSPMSDNLDLNKYRESIQKKRERLQGMSQRFGKAAEGETNEFNKTVAKIFSQYAAIMEDIFHNMEMLTIANFGLMNQNELLRDILVQLPEVKNNAQIQNDIEKAFGEYSELFRKQQESFERHSDDLGL